MKVTRKSMFSGKTRTLELDITQVQLNRWKTGELIQSVFPGLTISQREFLMTGAWDDEWDETFPDEESIFSDYHSKKPNRGQNIDNISQEIQDFMTNAVSLVVDGSKEK